MSTSNKVFASSFLLVGVRFLNRVIGLVSTLILARLLIPEDFGIVAITALVVQFADLLSNSGIKQYIPQRDHVDDTDLNTAWALDLMLKSLLWLVLLGAAPLIGSFYDDPRIVDALWAVSIVIVLRALQNPGLHLLRRDLEYSRIFWLTLTQKIVSFVVVIALAFSFRSFWAMIVGDLVYALVGVLGSYYCHSFRPKLSFARIGVQWMFTKWLLAKGVVGYFRAQADQILASKFFGVADFGGYNVIRGIAILPATDIVVPAAEPLLAAFARNKHNLVQLGLQLRICLLMVLVAVLPICGLLLVDAGSIVYVLLGDKWVSYASTFENLSILLLTFAVGSVLGQYFVALGRVRLVFYYNLATMLMIVCFLLVIPGETLDQFALNRGIIGAATTGPWMIFALVVCKSSLWRFCAIVLPAIAATGTAALAAVGLSAALAGADLSFFALATIFSLMLTTAAFGVTYLVVLTAFYLVWLRHVDEWRNLVALLNEQVFKKIRPMLGSRAP